jgi:nitrate/nitrite transporter NarK
LRVIGGWRRGLPQPDAARQPPMTTATTSNSPKGALASYFAAYRTLEAYPTGWYRRGLLALTVLATIISFYEFQFAPLLPLWLPQLHFSLEKFSAFLFFVVLLSGAAAMIGGPLADRHGRVVVIDMCLAALIVLTFCNVLMTGFWSFVLIRGLMNFVGGLMWGALGGLTRDFSPRLSRGTAFGLLTVGAVSCLYIWTAVAGLTLPIFGTWQSQIWIMGSLAVAIYIPVLLWLKDLHPSLRHAIIQSEEEALAGITFEGAELPQFLTGRAAFGQLLSHWEVWITVIGVVGFLTLPITSHTFLPEMFHRAFGYSPAEASRLTSYFWLLNDLVLVPAGWLSDKLRVRKPLSLAGAFVTIVLLAWWVGTFAHPLSPRAIGFVMLVLGGLAAFSFIPWCAQYSEMVEDISPALQASGWSFFQLIYRGWIAISGPLLAFVVGRYSWAAWMWITVAALCFFLPGLLLVRGGWRPAGSPAALATAPAPAAIGK